MSDAKAPDPTYAQAIQTLYTEELERYKVLPKRLTDAAERLGTLLKHHMSLDVYVRAIKPGKGIAAIDIDKDYVAKFHIVISAPLANVSNVGVEVIARMRSDHDNNLVVLIGDEKFAYGDLIGLGARLFAVIQEKTIERAKADARR